MASTAQAAPTAAPRSRRPPAPRWLTPVVLLVIGILLPWLQEQLAGGTGSWLQGADLVPIGIFIILAIGLNVVVGYAGLLDLGYVAFFAIGAYSMGWLASLFFDGQNVHLGSISAPGAAGIHINWVLVLILGGLICALAGVIIGAPTLRLKGDYLAIVTLGFGEIIPQFFRNGDHIGGHNLTGGAQGIQGLDGVGFSKPVHDATGGLLPTRFLIADVKWWWWICLVIIVLAVFVSLRLREGKLGRAWIAIREDELAASAMGIALMRTKLWSYGVGAFLGGLAGVYKAANQGSVFADGFQFQLSVLVLCMVIVGGMGNVYGVMLGAIILSWLNLRGLNYISTQFKSGTGLDLGLETKQFLIYGVLLVGMMLLRPEGFLPAARQRALIHETPATEAVTNA